MGRDVLEPGNFHFETPGGECSGAEPHHLVGDSIQPKTWIKSRSCKLDYRVAVLDPSMGSKIPPARRT